MPGVKRAIAHERRYQGTTRVRQSTHVRELVLPMGLRPPIFASSLARRGRACKRRSNLMEVIDRRSALALWLPAAAALPALITPTRAFAQRYRPDEGKEIAPGVRRVDLSKRASEIRGYATVSMRDIVYQPGAK